MWLQQDDSQAIIHPSLFMIAMFAILMVYISMRFSAAADLSLMEIHFPTLMAFQRLA